MTAPTPEQAYWCATCDRKRLHHTHPERPSMHNSDGSYKFPSVEVQR